MNKGDRNPPPSPIRARPGPEPTSDRDPSVMQLDDIPGIIRRGRRINDMSQRQLADYADISITTIGAVEAGQFLPSLTKLWHLLDALGFQLTVIDAEGNEVLPYDGDGKRDRAGRLFPAHLDVRPVGRYGAGWWGQTTVMPWIRPMPEHTFDLCRWRRDWLRRQANDNGPAPAKGNRAVVVREVLTQPRHAPGRPAGPSGPV